MTVPGILLVALYVALVCTPGILVAWFAEPGSEWLYEAGRIAALTGFMIIVMQVLLAARLKGIDRPFGLDIVFRFHRRIAIFAGLLLVSHPLLLAAGGPGFDFIIALRVPWYIWLGKIAVILLVINILLSVYRKRLRLSFERWRLLHDIVGVLLLSGIFVHSWFAGGDLDQPLLRGLWVVLAAAVGGLFVYHRVIRPALRRRHAWQITNVRHEADGVWTVEMEPPEGESRCEYKPGQFHFLTLHRGRGLPEEEHHFTISSSPSQPRRVTSSIKAVGDFTATIKDTRAGDKASVQGAFGRFSYRFHPGDHDLVFIAGGIGITPLMSMLRSMRDRQEDRRILLLYANRTERAIVFREELAAIEAGGCPALTVVHVLSRAGEEWAGEKGHIDRKLLERYVGGNIAGKAFYVCGPRPLLKSAISNLKAMGVKDRRIRMEIFSLVDD